MKRMIPCILIALAGLGACGLLVLRHAVRTSREEPAAEDHGAPTRKPQAADRWQDGIRIDTRTDYAPGSKAKGRIEEKLRQEELRQEPWERRN